jgi:hypothetical protein
MASAYNKFYPFTQALASGNHNFNGGSYHLMLSNSIYSNTANSYVGGTASLQAQEIPAGNNYPAGGPSITVSMVQNNTPGSANTKIMTTDLTIVATGTVGPFQYSALYGGTGNGAVGWFDIGGQVTLNIGDTITLNFDQANGLMQVS